MYQKVIIMGNLGGDPEMRYMPDGTALTSFSVATSFGWTDKSTGQPVKETTWFRVSVWGRQAETANQYLTKGQQVLVEGRLTPDRETGNPRLWTAQDGTVRASFEIRADNFRMVGSRGQASGGGGYSDDQYSGGGGSDNVQEEDDIPF